MAIAYDEASIERDSARASRHHTSSYVCSASRPRLNDTRRKDPDPHRRVREQEERAPAAEREGADGVEFVADVADESRGLPLPTECREGGVAAALSISPIVVRLSGTRWSRAEPGRYRGTRGLGRVQARRTILRAERVHGAEARYERVVHVVVELFERRH